MKLAPPRKKISPKLRAEVFAKTGGRCACGCNAKITTSTPWEVQHRIERALDGPDTIDNLEPWLKTCHAKHTGKRAAVLAKVKRIIISNNPETRKPSRMKSRGFQKPLKPYSWPKARTTFPSRPFPKTRPPTP